MDDSASSSVSSASASLPSSSSLKPPAKKRAAAARTKKEKAALAAAEATTTAHQLSDALTDTANLLSDTADPAPPLPSDDDGRAGEERRARKALGPSKRQLAPPLPPLLLPSSSPPPSVRLTPHSKQFLTPMSSARLLAFRLDETGLRDGTTRRLDYEDKTAPTPGRAESHQRQKQGLPLQVYCRIRPLSNEEQSQRLTHIQQRPAAVTGPLGPG